MVKAKLRGFETIVEDNQEAIGFLVDRGYGRLEDGLLTLSPVETLYLVSEGKIEVLDERDSSLSIDQLLSIFLSYDPDIWVKYLVYRDLRSKGYVVKEGVGFGCDFRVYRKGGYGREAARFLIFTLPEGRSYKLSELEDIASKTKRLGKDLILAIIDRRGDVVYYSLNLIPSKFKADREVEEEL
ncbi:MAG: tRNA-intron lyase [Nitrososphaerota archaeon]|nr:tRNA-intron lyase [Candidatus Bathyarchaeota archaeon]MCX8162050.1 tRNA-intron lyase [Candidatus Bathyarchaeota archaeon]MDW8061330.1 tRNA-intron lyase [Nitrososphaerota archaeon]